MRDDHPQLRPAGWVPYLAALLMAVAITGAVWPGFMSFDSILQLREARFGVEGGNYPTLPSYLWIPFDLLWPGPALMLTFQNALFLLAAAHLLARGTRWSAGVVTLLVAGLALLPPLFGPMLVVWKDVGMLALFTAAAAALLHAEGARAVWARRAALALAFVLLLAGAAYRLNALPAVLPLAAWLAFLLRPAARLWVRGAWTLLLLAGVTAGVYALNTWRLPDFQRLPTPTNVLKGLVFDLYGISHYSRELWIPPAFVAAHPDYGLADVDAVYRPMHMDFLYQPRPETEGARLPAIRLDPPSEVPALWRAAIRARPGAYLRHRAQVLAELVGFHRHAVFYPTHPEVDANDLGVSHRPTALTRCAVDYVLAASRTPLARCWIAYLGAALSLLLLRGRGGPSARAALALAASAALYLAPMLVLAIAADLRFNCWPYAASVLAVLLALAAWRAPRANAPFPGVTP